MSKHTVYTAGLRITIYGKEAQFIFPDWGDKVNSGPPVYIH